MELRNPRLFGNLFLRRKDASSRFKGEFDWSFLSVELQAHSLPCSSLLRLISSRILLSSSSYYEWIDRGGKSGKIPHYIRNPIPSSSSESSSTEDVDGGEAAGPIASSSSSAASSNNTVTNSSNKEAPFLYFAGLWDKVKYEGKSLDLVSSCVSSLPTDLRVLPFPTELDSAPLYTFTILTTQSSPRVNFIHTRMPVRESSCFSFSA